jgi:hypothetical protein
MQNAVQAVIQATPTQAATLQTQNNTQAQEATVALGPCRLACFIASAPNYGTGTTTDPEATVSASPAQTKQPGALNKGVGIAAAFYEQVGLIAAMSGVAVDVFASGPSPLGLHALSRVCLKSGGACFYYGDIEGSSLPQV